MTQSKKKGASRVKEMTIKETNLYTITRNREPNMDLMAGLY